MSAKATIWVAVASCLIGLWAGIAVTSHLVDKNKVRPLQAQVETLQSWLKDPNIVDGEIVDRVEIPADRVKIYWKNGFCIEAHYPDGGFLFTLRERHNGLTRTSNAWVSKQSYDRYQVGDKYSVKSINEFVDPQVVQLTTDAACRGRNNLGR